MSTTSKVNLEELTVDTTIELLWPPSGQWQTGTITHVWGNGEFAIQFEDDPFDEPLSYRLESYDFRVLSKATATRNAAVKTEKTEGENAPRDATKASTDASLPQTASSEAPAAQTATEEAASATTAAGDNEDAAEADEIEAVIDYVSNKEEDSGDVFDVYRIKWKGFGLSDATWEPRDHLNDASEMIDRYNRQINECNPNSSNIRNVRRSPFDNNLLHDLWNILGENKEEEYGVVWASEGRAFCVTQVAQFVSSFLSRNKHNIIDETNYDSFSERMTVLGFEQEKESKLYHHPCFNKQSNKLIDFIGKNSIPLPDDEEKAALFKSRVAKEKQEQSHPVIHELAIHETDVAMHQNLGRKRSRSEMEGIGSQKKRKVEASLTAEISNYNYGLFVPIESNLDLNQCHLWTEHEVAEWIRHLPDWGNYYAAKFIENGVDGRILLEFNNLDLVIKEADIQPIHRATFIYGVNTLRSVRKRGIEQMRKSQGVGRRL